MDRFMAAVRRLFGKKEHGVINSANKSLCSKTEEAGTIAGIRDSHENHNHNEKSQNNVQKAERKPHPYDEVKVDDEGGNVEVNEPNEFQKAPQRAPRSYEEVDLPTNNGGKVEIR